MSEANLTVNEKDGVKRLKRALEGWRECVLLLNSLLLWEVSWYPAVIAGASTALFLLLWLVEPSLLSLVSGAGLLVTVLDYLVPTLSATLFNPSDWTGAKEKQFEEVCRTVVGGYSAVAGQAAAFLALKASSPKLYYSVSVVSLALLAYIGNKINNLVLTYLLVTTLALLPGLSHHGLLQHYYQLVLHTVANALKTLNGGDKLKVK